MKSIITVAAILSLTILMSACQTTSEKFDTEKDVDISETHIVLPEGLLKLKGVEFKGGKINETGSFRREVAIFKNGYFTFDRYFMGGFHMITKEKFLKILNGKFVDIQSTDRIKTAAFAVGTVHYTIVHDLDNGNEWTCFAMAGNYGLRTPLLGGAGTEGSTYGEYCAIGNVPNFEEQVLPWVKKIRLR